MGATVYSVTTEGLFEEAQRTLDTHIMSNVDGRCRACGAPGPCWRREWAVSVYFRSLRLPCRTPGASQPALIGAGGPSLFQT